ncbi:MAG: short-chain dehydrogenase [Denitrovibrio sp.]|nr:MAG: short-chain dehydrogenase [Denitrovibrio sp.]
MDFKDKVAIVTGGAGGIGKVVADGFREKGAEVCIIDINKNDCFTGDIANESVLEKFAEKVIKKHQKVDFLINNAMPMMKGISDCTYEEFNYALKVGVSAPFYLTKLFTPYFSSDASVVNISSSRDRMSQPETESYSAAKGGISALTHSMAVSLAGVARVNSISPGWVNTAGEHLSEADISQHPAKKVGRPSDIAELVFFLCSDKAGFITGENICIDGGMTKQMIYSGEHGWKLER